MATNKYGLDVHYFSKKLECILRDIDYYSPAEMTVELDKLVSLSKEQDPLSIRNMSKAVNSHIDWKKEGGLYRHWKFGVKNLKEAFKLLA